MVLAQKKLKPQCVDVDVCTSKMNFLKELHGPKLKNNTKGYKVKSKHPSHSSSRIPDGWLSVAKL